jgi:V/A-type H+-transporting ATPase subunit D
MATKVRLTRPELKRYRDSLARYNRYLPMLKLKQQQLQMALRDSLRRRSEAEQGYNDIDASIRRYRQVFSDRTGVPLEEWARPAGQRTSTRNIAGVAITTLEEVAFSPVKYSFFGTPPWVDRALEDLRERSRCRLHLDMLLQEETLLRQSLTRIVQRVNLFEKVMIPQATDAIRRIRIKLGDDMTAGVGRAKIAKTKASAALADDAESATRNALEKEAR